MVVYFVRDGQREKEFKPEADQHLTLSTVKFNRKSTTSVHQSEQSNTLTDQCHHDVVNDDVMMTS